MTTSKRHLSQVVCWTRMQAEAGQDIRDIIIRKELERRAGCSVFFWGVGNAPSRFIKSLALAATDVDVVFSLMKSKPKMRDVAPSGVVVWQSYFDNEGIEHPLPPHVLVTSRMENASGAKKVHYALVCRSDDELQLTDYGAFDPSAYRNLGADGGPVSHSQVTALLTRTRAESPMSSYRINICARLADNYWVKLGRPYVLSTATKKLFAAISSRADTLDNRDWIEVVSKFRPIIPTAVQEQSLLF